MLPAGIVTSLADHAERRGRHGNEPFPRNRCLAIQAASVASLLDPLRAACGARRAGCWSNRTVRDASESTRYVEQSWCCSSVVSPPFPREDARAQLTAAGAVKRGAVGARASANVVRAGPCLLVADSESGECWTLELVAMIAAPASAAMLIAISKRRVMRPLMATTVPARVVITELITGGSARPRVHDARSGTRLRRRPRRARRARLPSVPRPRFRRGARTERSRS